MTKTMADQVKELKAQNAAQAVIIREQKVEIVDLVEKLKLAQDQIVVDVGDPLSGFYAKSPKGGFVGVVCGISFKRGLGFIPDSLGDQAQMIANDLQTMGMKVEHIDDLRKIVRHRQETATSLIDLIPE